MKIAICGLGKVGELLCHALNREEHDIIAIDQDDDKLKKLILSTDVTGISGGGSYLDVQLEAGVDSCDIFIAVTPDDETNIIAAITAKKIGARYVIARVRSPEYSVQLDFLRESLGIDLMINPDAEAAREIEQMMIFPAALSVEHFGRGKLFIVQTELPEDSIFVNQSLAKIGRGYGNVLIGVVERGNDLFIPGGSFVLKEKDRLYLTGRSEEILKFMHNNNHRIDRPKSVLIVGGGRITRYLLPGLKKHKIRAKLIENNEAIADFLAARHPETEVICADGTDQRVLREERMQNFDSVISLTGIDEENLLISLYASQQGVKNTITKVNRTNLLKVLANTGLQAIVTPSDLITDHILSFVRSRQNTAGSGIEALYRISGGKVEALQFKIASASEVCEKPLRTLETKEGLLILGILRGRNIIFPDGNDYLRQGDSVILVTSKPNLQDISDILKEG